MRTQSDIRKEGFALFASRISLHESACDYWRNEAEKIACRNAEEISAWLVCRFVSHVIARSIELADGRNDAQGIAVERIAPQRGIGRLQSQALAERSQSMLNSAVMARSGKPTTRRNQKALSLTDKAEIQGAVSLVLSYRNAWNRALNSDDWNKCFSLVESVDCLELNRRHRRLENATEEELTLARLAAPVFDLEIDASRIEKLSERLRETFELIDLASASDKSRKAKSNAEKWKAYAQATADGTAGNGKDKRERRRDRADFRAYLETGRKALELKALESAMNSDKRQALSDSLA